MIKRAWFLISIVWSLAMIAALFSMLRPVPRETFTNIQPIGYSTDVGNQVIITPDPPQPSHDAQMQGVTILLVFLAIPWLMFPAASYIRHGFTPKSLR